MKRVFYQLCYSIFLIPLLLGCQKKEMSSVEDSKSYSISSSYTSSEYNLQILYPENYNSSLEYQTIYLLDGDWYFNELAEVIMSNSMYSTDIVLIGIGYKNDNKRNTDYSYPEDSFLPNSGGAKNYIQFLNFELIPFIENNLSIQSSKRTLAGHSLGGYFGQFLLFQQEYPNPFDNIISASPSLWWGNAYILDLEEQFSATNDTLNIRLYSTIGDSEGVTMNTMFNAFNEKIKSRNYQGFKFEYERFENTTHNNSPIESFDKGISFILN